MERAFNNGWTEWQPYKLQNKHRDHVRLVGDEIEVRIRFPGEVRIAFEVRFDTRNGWTYLYPEATEWYFPGLEDEQQARDTREPNDKPLKPY